jgi:hypothetical protein
MPLPSSRRMHASVQVRARAQIRAEFKAVSLRIAGLLALRALPDGTLNPQSENTLRRSVGDILSAMFVNPDPFSGVTALAPYPRTLNRAYVRATGLNVQAHQTWLQRTLPDDLYQWLAGAQMPPGLQETISPQFIRKALLAFQPLHTWQDERGYVLSDRIWRTEKITRQQLEDVLVESIRQGRSATATAKLIERFLNPDAAALRTKKPYGRDGSMNTVRLARTEISRAHNVAAHLSAMLNPYVEGIDIARSPNGDPSCPICPTHATIDISGARIREPYPKDNAPIPPFHPHDLCNVQSVVTENPQAVTAELRGMYERGDPAPMTPAAGNTLLMWMLGAELFQLWRSESAA